MKVIPADLLAISGDTGIIAQQIGIMRVRYAEAVDEGVLYSVGGGKHPYVLDREFRADAYSLHLQLIKQGTVTALVIARKLRIEVEDGAAKLLERGVTAFVIVLEIRNMALLQIVYAVKDMHVAR